MTPKPDDYADTQKHRYRELWAAALGLYLKDAIAYATGRLKPTKHHKAIDREEAYADLLATGPTLLRFCRLLDLNPDWIRRITLAKIEGDLKR